MACPTLFFSNVHLFRGHITRAQPEYNVPVCESILAGICLGEKTKIEIFRLLRTSCLKQVLYVLKRDAVLVYFPEEEREPQRSTSIMHQGGRMSASQSGLLR
ncbi:MAG TPA: hypothetical protein VGL74_10340 [Terriglobales bacterium]|jgi:hypothetical protein